MTRVWLLRHAETATPMVFHGAESDELLSDHGRRQAAAAAEWFKTIEPDIVVSSRMRRAVSTAAPIAAAGKIPHLIEEQLHERRVGALCGTSFSLREGPWVETLSHWTSANTSYTTSGAESYDDLVTRLVPAFERIIQSHANKRIVIVAHGIVCKVLLLTLLPGWGPTRWHELGKVHNLSVSELTPLSAGRWQFHMLLTVPPPVLALREVATVIKSET